MCREFLRGLFDGLLYGLAALGVLLLLISLTNPRDQRITETCIVNATPAALTIEELPCPACGPAAKPLPCGGGLIDCPTLLPWGATKPPGRLYRAYSADEMKRLKVKAGDYCDRMDDGTCWQFLATTWEFIGHQEGWQPPPPCLCNDPDYQRGRRDACKFIASFGYCAGMVHKAKVIRFYRCTESRWDDEGRFDETTHVLVLSNGAARQVDSETWWSLRIGDEFRYVE